MEAGPLLAWFSQHRRSFPWRTPFPRDPYVVLVSEVMLQQTQASRVAELFPRFLQRFPNLQALARAGEEEVVAAFAGLGYYRRARLLHRLAQQVAASGWPREAKELARLPGLGPYTAAALAAFAFGALKPPVDGNLCRIAARVFALELAHTSPTLVAKAQELARELVAERPTPEVFEALMELGATLCTPREPRCQACPLAPHCAGYQSGQPAAFPLPKPTRLRETPTWVALWVENHAGEVLLRRITEPPLQGLWLPPLDRGTGDPQKRAAQLAREAGVPENLTLLGKVLHHITHRRITVMLFRVKTGFAVRETRNDFRWLPPSAFLPTSSLVAKLAQLARENQWEGRKP